MNSFKRTNHLLVQNYLSFCSLRQASASTDQIRLPNYIPRGKTDILKELSSTVEQSPHFMPYGYFNDPHLAPKNVRDYKNFALSKESGMKAAQYFMKNYPELFYRDQAEPKIEKLSYPDVYDDQMEFDLEDIRSAIEKRNVSNAIVAFKKMSEQGQEISADIKLATFQLVCFFNSEDSWAYVDELPHSRNLALSLIERKNRWNTNGFAEQMWKEIFSQENNIEANSTYIEALVRFGSFNRAYTVYKSFEKDGKDINLDAINALIRSTPFNDSINPTVAEFKNWVKLLNQKSFQPTIETINSLLFALTQNIATTNLNEVISFVQSLLQDCKTLELTPTLGTYSYVMDIFYCDSGSKDGIIYKIIDRLEERKIELVCKDDLLFFDSAMKVASQNLSDVELSIRIYDLFKKHSNMYLNVYREGNFYEYFFNSLAKGVPTDVLFDYYKNICPGIFFPTPGLFECLTDHVIVFQSFDYIEKLFAELDKYTYFNWHNLTYKIFHLIVSVERNEKIDKIFVDYLLKCFSRVAQIQQKAGLPNAIERNAKILNAILEHLCILGEQVKVVELIIENGYDIQLAEKKNIKEFFSKLLEQLVNDGKAKEAVNLLKFIIAKEYGGLDDNVVRTVNLSKLTIAQKQLVKNLLMLC